MGTRICYVRFGRKSEPVPRSGKSFNSLEQREEAGVSVYEALCREGDQYQIILPPISSTTVATLGMCLNVAQGLWGLENNPLYEVTGDLVGVGSDGEPLLKNCRVVKPIFHLSRDHYVAELSAKRKKADEISALEVVDLETVAEESKSE